MRLLWQTQRVEPSKHLTSANQAHNQQEYHSLASKTGDHEWILTTTTGDHEQLLLGGSYATWRKRNKYRRGSVWQDVHSYHALCGGKVTRQPAKSDRPNKWHPTQKRFITFSVFLFFSESLWRKLFLPPPPPFPSTPWTYCGMAGRPIRVLERFTCSYPFKSPNNTFSYLGRNRAYAQPRSMKPRKERNGCIMIYPEQLPPAK